jgi:hypothetical protein
MLVQNLHEALSVHILIKFIFTFLDDLLIPFMILCKRWNISEATKEMQHPCTFALFVELQLVNVLSHDRYLFLQESRVSSLDEKEFLKDTKHGFHLVCIAHNL